jgi:succinate-semialdehyde dehydrogenase / glutarate-semialdehyde dehydrogenase
MTTALIGSAAPSQQREANLLASIPTRLLIGHQWREASDGGTFDGSSWFMVNTGTGPVM